MSNNTLAKKSILFIFTCFFILAFISGCSSNPAPIENGEEGLSRELEVHFIDVGQGDSTLIKLPNKESILIDAGKNVDSELVVNYLKKEGIKKIDYVIGTHPHEDHIGGLDVVIESFEIGRVYLPRVVHTTKTYEDVLLAIKNKNLKVIEAKGGVTLDIPEVNAIFVAPNSSEYKDINNYSAVLKLTYQDTSFIFTGDAEELSENEMLLQSYTNLDTDVLKVAHHGSSTSTSEAFLEAVSPKYAVISLGENNTYGHPHFETIDKLNRHQIKYFRTDLQGDIIATSDGTKISFNQQPITIQNDTNNLVEIQSIDLKAEVVILVNKGSSSVDLTDWKLVSLNGDQVFNIPVGTILKPGKTIKIVSGSKGQEGPDTLLWTNNNIWNNDGDPGALYDNQGNLVSEFK